MTDARSMMLQWYLDGIKFNEMDIFIFLMNWIFLRKFNSLKLMQQ